MAGEVLYADLKLPGASSQPPCHASGQTKPHIPPWYRPAFRISGVLNVALLLAVIAVGIFGFLCNQDDSDTRAWGTRQNDSSPCPSAAALCPCLPGNEFGFQPCPMNWPQHKGKCYYFSRDPERNWSRSREDCAERDSQLLVIQDQEEKDFIHRTIGDRYHWIGLHLPAPGRNWTWLDGSPFNQTLVSVSGSTEQGRCVVMGHGRFYSNFCNTTYTWICQKEAGKE
ncbi:killer cell lectin-like receptor subfamily B member 1B allele C isoform X2 [Rhinatrema bivittatum]|uniref:killer cell lectin-like receptor subfamily B member 1B allele C isoform X2 n=1 Tax=Rhinatrema bivittatum TaxID=194408 RepID=UPI00112B6D09|nr:killer cell lectin-like receptor subfamily B member 1B allele C isoform X2 [Rhinatrema bivittatum]